MERSKEPLLDGAPQPCLPPTDWRDRAPWLMLVDTTRHAARPTLLLLAYLGTLLVSAGWRASGWLCLDLATTPLRPSLVADANYLSQTPGGPGHRPPWLPPPLLGLPSALRPALGDRWPDDPLTSVPYRLLRPWERQWTGTASRHEALFYFLGGVWTLIVWATLGGMITRMAVFRWGRGEQLAAGTAIAFGLRQAGRHLRAWFLPLLAVATLGLPVYLLGGLTRWAPCWLLVGCAWLGCLPFWLLAGVVFLGWLLGWPLLWGAIAADSADAFDAVSRAGSYALQRPARYAGYLLAAFIPGLLAWLLLWCGTEAALNSAHAVLARGAGPQRAEWLHSLTTGPPAASGPRRWGSHLLRAGDGAVRGLVSAFAHAYFWSAYAGIYLLLRQDVDDAELDELLGAEPPLAA